MLKKENTATGLRPFGARDKWGYALGDFGGNMSFALTSYLMLFYTQYIGLNLATWGIIILALKIWDGINDPIMGSLMDFLKPGKRGKFKTYIFYGSFVLAVSGALCFLPIPNAPMPVKILVCVVGYLTWDVAATIVGVPYGSMNAVISADPVARAQLSTYRNMGGVFGAVMIAVLLPIFCFDSENNLIGNRMFILALVLGAIGFIAYQIMLRWVLERVKVKPEKKSGEGYSYFRSVGSFLTNRAAIVCTLSAMVGFFIGHQVLNQILFQTFFKNAQIFGIFGLAVTLPMFVLMPFVKPIVARFGKREAATAPMLIGLVANLLMMVLPIDPETGLPLWFVLNMISGASVAMSIMLSWAMVADCIDYQELRTGRREEGTVYATYSLGRKIAQGLSASAVAYLLLMVGYDESLGAQQTAEVGNNIRLLSGGLVFVAIAIQFVLMRFLYPLDKKTVDEMERKLGHSNNDIMEAKE